MTDWYNNSRRTHIKEMWEENKKACKINERMNEWMNEDGLKSLLRGIWTTEKP